MNNQPNPLYDELADKLEPLSKANQKINLIVQRCRGQQYHDFLTDLATPKLQMIADLERAGLHDEVAKVKDGYYDE